LRFFQQLDEIRNKVHLNLTDSFFDEFFFTRAIVGENILVVEKVFTENKIIAIRTS